MLEKSGTIVLTEQDLVEYSQGTVSDRLKETWGLTYEELCDIVEKNNYKRAEND